MEHKDDRAAMPGEVTNKTKRKPGRPRKNLDERQIQTLAEMGCTYAEIAAVMGCSEPTLRSNYLALIKDGFSRGNASIRRSQFKAALSGNTTMLVWLGKQRLGQRDNVEVNLDKDAIKEFQRALSEQEKAEGTKA